MSKSATIKSVVSIIERARPAAGQSRYSANMKVIVGVGAAILVLGGLIIAAMPEPAANNPKTVASRSTASANSAGALSAPETNFNFGSISMAGGKVTHSYRIRNTGTEPMLIRKMYTSCMCTTAALVKSGRKFEPYGMPGHGFIPRMNEPVNPKEEAIIEVVFDPAAHGPAGIGPVDRFVTVENSAGRPLELAFTANVKP